jgi:hypothetical protein
MGFLLPQKSDGARRPWQFPMGIAMRCWTHHGIFQFVLFLFFKTTYITKQYKTHVHIKRQFHQWLRTHMKVFSLLTKKWRNRLATISPGPGWQDEQQGGTPSLGLKNEGICQTFP